MCHHNDRVYGDCVCPNFAMDGSTIHETNLLMNCGKTLTNCGGSTAGHKRSGKYHGIIGTRPFATPGKFYFEVDIKFTIYRRLQDKLLFEIGVARREETERNHTVSGSKYGWVVCASTCSFCKTICLQTLHNRKVKRHKPLIPKSDPGNSCLAKVGIFIDTRAHQMVVIDAKQKSLFYRFKNVDYSQPLWPVFGTYNSGCASVKLTTRTARDVLVPSIYFKE
ncbi:hypothetical protein CHS0354_001780 [Potamilus streckersoni]|uniref:B30.2/SPRY domain-containing protein n=1 Tax=Potamilus streckersoni TaxID=2493646 RepID=A0AAE0T1A0_9BIVA|nr:hypothetical protein CHS0354_001780 [Potamilus streckersoni]